MQVIGSAGGSPANMKKNHEGHEKSRSVFGIHYCLRVLHGLRSLKEARQRAAGGTNG
jgi:hypothetical protein